MALTGSFSFNGATVTVQRPTVATRVKLWQFRQTITIHGSGSIPRDIADTLCYYLANTVNITGSLGFSVPLAAPSHEQLIAFLEAFADADETLVTAWDSAIYGLKYATNDPDLLPPDEVEKKD